MNRIPEGTGMIDTGDGMKYVISGLLSTFHGIIFVFPGEGQSCANPG